MSGWVNEQGLVDGYHMCEFESQEGTTWHKQSQKLTQIDTNGLTQVHLQQYAPKIHKNMEHFRSCCSLCWNHQILNVGVTS